MSFTVAIDGPAAAGKGTIARAVAAHFRFAHLDTGLLYRAVGAMVLDGADPVVAARTLVPEVLDDPRLRTSEMAQAASKVAVIAEVRSALLVFQRAFATQAGGAVLDGRDIGTVVCPDARVKLFVTASVDVRAKRRHAELVANGADVTLAQVMADVMARDARDMDRDQAPLRPAKDAVVLDTSQMGISEAVSTAIATVTASRTI
jgi:cytidylate kinase